MRRGLQPRATTPVWIASGAALDVTDRRLGGLTAQDVQYVDSLPQVRRLPSATGLVLLRELLADHVPEAAMAPVVRGAGKPVLDHPGLDYSVSHSGGQVLAALGQGWLVGVDVQRAEPRWDVDRMADLVLHPREIAQLAVGHGSLHERFAEIWARKEALVKLTGEGVGPRITDLDTTSTTDLRGGAGPCLASVRVGGYALAVALAAGIGGDGVVTVGDL